MSGPGENSDGMGTMLNIDADTLQFIVDKAREFQMVGEAPDESSPEERDPAYAELKATIVDLEPDQQVSLVALMWLGRGDYTAEEWDQALAAAGEAWNERSAEYLIGSPMLADYLNEGLNQLDSTPD
jgi:Protein of unknown function (DUF3775)